MPSPEKVLHELLRSLFTADELRQFLTYEFGDELTSALPVVGTYEDILFATVRLLTQHGHVDASFFTALTRKFPKRGSEITAVAAACGVDGSQSLRALEVCYLRRVVEEFERLTFQGIVRSGKAVSLRLEDVYVELKAVTDMPEAADAYSAEERRLLLGAESRGMEENDLRRQLDSLRVERWREEGRRAGTRLVRRSIEHAVADPSRPGIVILGDPGSGKSTLLKYLALRSASAGLRADSDERPAGLLPRTSGGAAHLPIFVPLAAYDDWLRRDANQQVSLAEFLSVYHEKWRSTPGLAPLFARALEEGRALVLLDGLDEVLDVTTRRHIASQVNAFIQAEAGRGNRFAVTSRVVGYRETPLPGDLPHVTVLDFGESEIVTFARRWCQACEVWLADGQRTEKVLHQAANEERALLAEMKANPSVLHLAANPLLLTMLALLRRQGGKLPEERVRLYQHYTDLLLDSGWENARNDGARTRDIPRLDQNLATRYLMGLALWLQRFKPSGTARKSDILHALVNISLVEDGLDAATASEKERREAHAVAEQFVREMRHFAGLLAERGQDAYGFLHLTFQEYFAGRALARMPADERWAILQPNLHRPRWREPILLCAGQLGILEQRTREVSVLGRKILAAASPHEELLHRGALSAAAFVTDGVPVDRALRNQIKEKLVALSTDHIPDIRRSALRALVKLARAGDHEDIVELLVSRIDSWELGALSEMVDALVTGSFPRIRHRLIEDVDESTTWEYYPGLMLSLMTSDEDLRARVLSVLESGESFTQHLIIHATVSLMVSDKEVRRLILDKIYSHDEALVESTLSALGSSGFVVARDCARKRSLIRGRCATRNSMHRSSASPLLGA